MDHVPPPTSAVLAGLLQYRLDHHPDGVLNVFPSRTGDVGVVTYRDFALGCQRFMRAVYPHAPVARGEVVGLLLQCDTLMYQTAICGLVWAGLTPFPICTRFSPHTICNLLQSVSAHRIMTTSPAMSALVESVRDEMATRSYDVVVEDLPAFDDVYPNLFGGVDVEEVRQQPLPSADVYPGGVEIWLHSSGSTGQPKPLPMTHDFFAKLQYADGHHWFLQQAPPIVLNSSCLPLFNMMGILTQIAAPLITGVIVSTFALSYPEPPALATPRAVMDAMKMTKSTAVCVPPAFLESWALEENSVVFLKSLAFAAYGGRPLATAVGDDLTARGVSIASAYGCTELGPMSHSFHNDGTKDGWEWIRLSSHITARWIPQDQELFELHVLSSDTQPMAMSNLPNGAGYATGDLFLKHPTMDGLWKLVGRANSWVVMRNGQKTLPSTLENALHAHLLVLGAVVFGHGQDHIGVLIELKSAKPAYSHDEQTELRTRFWALLEDVNRQVLAHSRILKEMIIFAVSTKPLPRIAKGSINQKAAWAEYEQEIDDLRIIRSCSMTRWAGHVQGEDSSLVIQDIQRLRKMETSCGDWVMLADSSRLSRVGRYDS